jgi:hypothetical protein
MLRVGREGDREDKGGREGVRKGETEVSER